MNQAGDSGWMERALRLAAQGEGWVEPNPMVGCVITRDGELLGEGWHQRFGGNHAEIVALANCKSSPKGATAWVTLEPCCHHGKTPPCVNALIAARVARVVVAMEDPFPQVAGRGIAALRDAGVAVETGMGREKAESLNAPYLRRIHDSRPWVIAKWAMTLDGKLATTSGHSQWISSEGSRSIVHQLRGRMDAILIGAGTVIADDPMLTARPPGTRVATRVVLDSGLRIPVGSKLLATSGDVPVLVAAGPKASEEGCNKLRGAGCEVVKFTEKAYVKRLERLLTFLAGRGMTNVLVEGGGKLLGELFDARLVDEVHVFISPTIVGGKGAVSPVGGVGIEKVSDALRLADTTLREVDEDCYISGRIKQ